jgi:hypothetical protein
LNSTALMFDCWLVCTYNRRFPSREKLRCRLKVEGVPTASGSPRTSPVSSSISTRQKLVLPLRSLAK